MCLVKRLVESNLPAKGLGRPRTGLLPPSLPSPATHPSVSQPLFQEYFTIYPGLSFFLEVHFTLSQDQHPCITLCPQPPILMLSPKLPSSTTMSFSAQASDFESPSQPESLLHSSRRRKGDRALYISK